VARGRGGIWGNHKFVCEALKLCFSLRATPLLFYFRLNENKCFVYRKPLLYYQFLQLNLDILIMEKAAEHTIA
jgi:hypothetical protein